MVLGLGHLPLELLRRTELKKLNVKILNPKVFSLVLSLRDHRSWMQDPRVGITLASLDKEVQQPHFACPPELLLTDDASSKLCDRISSDIGYESAKLLFSDKERDFFRKRIKSNFNHIKNDKDVELLTNQSSGGAAFVIAAGPSLTTRLEYIKKRLQDRDRPICICLDTASKALKSAGIIPDFVVSIDYLIAPHHHEFSDNSKTSLVYFPTLPPDIISGWKGERYVAFGETALFQEVRKKFSRGDLYSGGSVIHPATDLAVKMGCVDITFFGADFSFSNGQSHAGWKNALPGNNLDKSHRWILNGYGDRVKTMENLRMYLVELERYIQYHPNIHFWNSSKIGALIEGCDFRSEFT